MIRWISSLAIRFSKLKSVNESDWQTCIYLTNHWLKPVIASTLNKFFFLVDVWWLWLHVLIVNPSIIICFNMFLFDICTEFHVRSCYPKVLCIIMFFYNFLMVIGDFLLSFLWCRYLLKTFFFVSSLVKLHCAWTFWPKAFH